VENVSGHGLLRFNFFQERAFSAERSFFTLGKSERCAKSKAEQTQRLASKLKSADM